MPDDRLLIESGDTVNLTHYGIYTLAQKGIHLIPTLRVYTVYFDSCMREMAVVTDARGLAETLNGYYLIRGPADVSPFAVGDRVLLNPKVQCAIPVAFYIKKVYEVLNIDFLKYFAILEHSPGCSFGIPMQWLLRVPAKEAEKPAGGAEACSVCGGTGVIDMGFYERDCPDCVLSKK